MSPSKSHHRNSSSDGLFDCYSSAFTEEDFKRIDEAVAAACGTLNNSSFPSEIDGLNFNLLTEGDWAKLDDFEQSTLGNIEEPFDTSFASEIDGLNLGTLTEEDFEKLDTFVSESYSLAGGPSIPVVLEHSSSEVSAARPVQMRYLRSPMRQFRRHGILSVTDLSHPTWCEVQFDYGLRGKRSRPIEKRPPSFKSASGKQISVEPKVAQKNDIRTKQGLAVHKELQREIRAKELEVDITTKETQWALRIVNVLACLKELLHGPRNMTREMPVFGILHDEVVVGIIDELVCEPSVDCSTKKRKARDKPSKGRPKKRLSLSGSPNVNSDGSIESNDPSSDCEEPKSSYTLHIRDAKTRNRHWIPSDTDALSGRLQLSIYFTLLRNLISREPPFDFDLLWKKLDVNPDAKLPKKFLVQAQLISDNQDFELTSLNDLVASFYKFLSDQAMHVSPILELVYYLRPAKDWKGKGVEQDSEPLELMKAVAAGSKRLATGNGTVLNEAGTSRRPRSEQYLEGDVMSAKESRDDDVDQEEGIRRFPLIGRKTFIYNKQEMDVHVSRLLGWWRGERPPEGVPVHLTSRCRTCEYSNDCEWRDAKALELSKTSRFATIPNALQP